MIEKSSIINHQSAIRKAIMSIKFVCSCGKHLRARDEMAARRSMCPRCGAPVGVPSMQPTHAGTTAAPLTPQERRRRNRNNRKDEPDALATAAQPSLMLPAGSSAEADPSAPKVYRRRRQLEQHWYQCLAYPFLSRNVLLCFALILSVGMGSLILALQSFLQSRLPWAAGILIVGLIVAYAYSTVECALASALAGKGAASYLPAWSAADPVKSGVRWLFCFVAGPIVPAALAAYFWFYGGDLKAVDWAIVAELGGVAAAYWFLAIVCANERNRLRDANPARVAQLVQRLKLRAIVPILIAPALAMTHVLVGLFAVSSLHQHVFGGWILLAACLCSALFWSAFFFRLLGVWCYRIPPIEMRP
jgi:hypothetical protein